MSNRIQSLDFLKCFAIFCVVWGHSLQYLAHSSTGFFTNPAWSFIYSFHMPLFMLISGFFSASSLRLGFMPFFRKKFMQLIMPCITCGILLCGILFLLSPNGSDINYLVNQDFNAFWFLKSLFWCYLIAFIARRITRNRYLFVIICLVLSSIYDFRHVTFMMPYFLLGLALSYYREQWSKHIPALLSVFSVCFIAVLYLWDGTFTVYHKPSITLFGLFLCDKPFNLILASGFRYFVGIAGSLTFFFLFAYLFRRNYSGFCSDGLLKIGQNTLAIYLLQTFMFAAFDIHPLFERIAHEWAYNFVITPLFAVVSIIGLMIIIRIIGKSRFISYWFLGKK